MKSSLFCTHLSPKCKKVIMMLRLRKRRRYSTYNFSVLVWKVQLLYPWKFLCFFFFIPLYSLVLKQQLSGCQDKKKMFLFASAWASVPSACKGFQIRTVWLGRCGREIAAKGKRVYGPKEKYETEGKWYLKGFNCEEVIVKETEPSSVDFLQVRCHGIRCPSCGFGLVGVVHLPRLRQQWFSLIINSLDKTCMSVSLSNKVG